MSEPLTITRKLGTTDIRKKIHHKNLYL